MLDALLENLGVVDPILVGHSLGADITIALLEHGRRARGLVILGEAPDYSLATVPTINKLLRLPVIGGPLYRALPAAAGRQALEGWLAPGKPLSAAFDDPQQAVRDLRSVPYPAFRDTQDEKERYAADQPLDARVSALGADPLVIFGEQDQLFRSVESCARYRTVANAVTELVPDAGHLVMAEQPVPVADHIRRYAATRPPAAGGPVA